MNEDLTPEQIAEMEQAFSEGFETEEEGGLEAFAKKEEETPPPAVTPAPAPPTSPTNTKESDEAKEVVNEIFIDMGMKVATDDPLVTLMVANMKLVKRVEAQFEKTIQNNTAGLMKEFSDNLAKTYVEFDKRTDGLNKLLNSLDDRKEVIITEVWSKLNVKVTELIQAQLTKDLQAIANNANNKVNNQRNMLIGGALGVLIGIILTVVVSALK